MKNYIIAPRSGEYKFNISRLVECDANGIPIKINGVYKFKEGILEEIRTGAIAIRESDANALKTGFNQAGEFISIDKSLKMKKELKEYARILEQNKDATNILNELKKLEVENSSISIVSRKGKIKLEGDITINGQEMPKNDVDFSRSIILGEHNRSCRNPEFDGKGLTYHYDVATPYNPACTIQSIDENMGEYKTFNRIQQTVCIHLPENTPEEVLQIYGLYRDSNISLVNIEIMKGEELWK